jgi:hypothetical protein
MDSIPSATIIEAVFPFEGKMSIDKRVEFVFYILYPSSYRELPLKWEHDQRYSVVLQNYSLSIPFMNLGVMNILCLLVFKTFQK